MLRRVVRQDAFRHVFLLVEVERGPFKLYELTHDGLHEWSSSDTRSLVDFEVRLEQTVVDDYTLGIRYNVKA